MTFHEFTADNNGGRPQLNHSCVATYIPKDVSYNLNISWMIVDERALDAITGYALTLSTNDPTYHPLHSGLTIVKKEVNIYPSVMRLIHCTCIVYTQENQTDFVHVYPIKVVKDVVGITVVVSYGLNICMILKDKAFMFAKTWLKRLRNTWAAKCGNGDLPCLDTLDSIPIPCYYCTLGQ